MCILPDLTSACNTLTVSRYSFFNSLSFVYTSIPSIEFHTSKYLLGLNKKKLLHVPGSMQCIHTSTWIQEHRRSFNLLIYFDFVRIFVDVEAYILHMY